MSMSGEIIRPSQRRLHCRLSRPIGKSSAKCSHISDPLPDRRLHGPIEESRQKCNDDGIFGPHRRLYELPGNFCQSRRWGADGQGGAVGCPIELAPEPAMSLVILVVLAPPLLPPSFPFGSAGRPADLLTTPDTVVREEPAPTDAARPLTEFPIVHARMCPACRSWSRPARDRLGGSVHAAKGGLFLITGREAPDPNAPIVLP